MANIQKYPRKDFSTQQTFLAYDPSQGTVRVSGQDIVDSIDLGAPIQLLQAEVDERVQYFRTTDLALLADLPISRVIYTTGASAENDGLGAHFVVVAAGTPNSLPMTNGNALLQLEFISQPVTYINSVADIAGFTGAVNDQQISLKGWHPDSDVGGGMLYWDADKPKSSHNGGTVFSPTVPFGTAANYLDGVGETDPAGNGCWVRLLEGFVTPEMLGAVGDGVADDTGAAQAAINVAKAKNGALAIRLGTHKVSSLSVSDFDRCLIVGGKLISLTPAAYPFGTLSITNSESVTVDGVVFDGENQSASAASRGLISADTCNNLAVKNCVLNTPGGYTLTPLRSQGVIVRNNSFFGGSVWAVGCPGITIAENKIKGSALDSIKLTSYAPAPEGTPATHFCDGAIVSDNSITDSQADFIDVYAAGRNIQITGNYMSGAAVHGVQIKNVYRDPADYMQGGSSNYLGQTFNINVSANTIKSVSGHGVHMVTDDLRASPALTDSEKLNGISVTGNIISLCDRGVYYRDVLDVHVSGNSIHESVDYGVFSGASKRTSVVGNKIKGSATAGIYYGGPTDASITEFSVCANVVNDSAVGVVVRGYDGSVSGNMISGADTFGISTLYTLNVTVTGNAIGTPSGGKGAVGSIGIRSEHPSYTVYSSNTVRDNAIGYSFNSSAASQSTDGVISSNTSFDCTTPAQDNLASKAGMQIGLNTFSI